MCVCVCDDRVGGGEERQADLCKCMSHFCPMQRFRIANASFLGHKCT